jgi:hypothetical protein
MKDPNGYELNASHNAKKVKFMFTSVGDNGSIEKIIEFSLMTNNIWNLGFGDVKGKTWTDTAVSNNNDLRKVLQTVANAVHLFLEAYPERQLFFKPVDRKRKLLYNRTFQQKWHEIEPLFTVKAVNLEDTNPKFKDYNPKKLYDLFTMKKKIS